MKGEEGPLVAPFLNSSITIFSKVINLHKLDEFENDVAIILCKLEMYFLHFFFAL